MYCEMIPACSVFSIRTAFYRSLRRTWWTLNRNPAPGIARVLKQSQWWSREQLEAYRDEKLARLVEHCYKYVPYYRKVMTERGLKPADVHSAADLARFPILTKSLVRHHWNGLRAINVPDREVFVASTGGTTGEPMKIVKPLDCDAWTTMCFERGLSWGGLKPDMKRVHLTGGSIGASKRTEWQKVIDRLSGRINLLAYDLGEQNVREYADIIRKGRIEFIIGYASNIYLLARLLQERGESLNLRAVFTTAELLLPKWAATIKAMLNCKVYSYYGCGESNSLGYQCREGDAYHIPEEHVILEAEPDGAASNLSGRGQALITDLDNTAMPLLRYQNGDYIRLDDTPCSCGRSLRLISKLEGRTYEFLLSTSGELVSAGICDVILGNVESVREFQVRQDAAGHARVIIVPSKNITDEQKAYIREAFQFYLGKTFRIDIERVDGIPRTKAQKLQTAINELL